MTSAHFFLGDDRSYTRTRVTIVRDIVAVACHKVMNNSALAKQALRRYYCVNHYCAGIQIDTAPAFASQEYGSAKASVSAYSGTQAPMLPNPTGYARGWDAGGDDVEPLGLEAAIAAAKASNEAKAQAQSIAFSGANGTSAAGGTIVPQSSLMEEVIDLLSGDDEDTADSGGGGEDLGENGRVSHTARVAGTSCNELVLLDDDTVEETCAVSSPHKSVEHSETRPPSCGPDKPPEFSEANPPLCGSDKGLEPSEAKPASCGPDKYLESPEAKPPSCGSYNLTDANASPNISDPLQSTGGRETEQKPDDDHVGRGAGDEPAVPAPAMKTNL